MKPFPAFSSKVILILIWKVAARAPAITLMFQAVEGFPEVHTILSLLALSVGYGHIFTPRWNGAQRLKEIYYYFGNKCRMWALTDYGRYFENNKKNWNMDWMSEDIWESWIISLGVILELWLHRSMSLFLEHSGYEVLRNEMSWHLPLPSKWYIKVQYINR